MVEFRVQQIYFDDITNGRKTIEGRLAKDKYLQLKPGERVRFSNTSGTQVLVKKVVAVHMYRTFEEAFSEQDYQKAIPSARNTAEAVRVYERFYSREQQAQTGVVFVELK